MTTVNYFGFSDIDNDDCCMKEHCENKATMFEEVSIGNYDNIWCAEHAPQGCVPILNKDINT